MQSHWLKDFDELVMVIDELSVVQNIEKRDVSELIPISDMVKLACERSSWKEMKVWKLVLVSCCSRDWEGRREGNF
jgi:hypothetical protein